MENRILIPFIAFTILSSGMAFPFESAFAVVPNAPTNLGDSGAPGATNIPLSWSAPGSGQAPDGYRIDYATETSFGNFGSFSTIVADTGSDAVGYNVTGLVEGEFYRFRVYSLHGTDVSTGYAEADRGTKFESAQNFSGGHQNFYEGQHHAEGTQFAAGQSFTGGTQNFGAGQTFGAGTSFTTGQDFSTGTQTFGANSHFEEGATFAAGQAFSGTQNFNGQMEFKEGAQFAENQSFGNSMTFDGANTFAAGTVFGAPQDFTAQSEQYGPVALNAISTGTTSPYTVLAAVTAGAVTQISDVNGGDFDTGILYFDFPNGTLTGKQFNDVQFTDSNSNGKIDCTSIAACELATLSEPVTVAATTQLLIIQDSVQTFGAGTAFTGGVTFPKGQGFDGVMDFSNGAQTFSPNMSFFAGQDFSAGGHNHDFDKIGLQFGAGTIFPANEEFGEGLSFTQGTQAFAGSNTFKDGSKFAAGQSFSAAQNFYGAMEFGDNTTFDVAMDFSHGFETAGAKGVGAITSPEKDFYDIFQTFDVGAGESVTALNGGAFETGVIFADFNSVLTGYAINDVQFTDSNSNGKIDCTSDGACELADLFKGVTLDGSENITFAQEPAHTFGPGTDFPAGTSFAKGTAFPGVMDFAGAMTFEPGMQFYAGQDFSTGGHNHDFDKHMMEFGAGAIFAANEEFGIGADFDAGYQPFAGSNTFKDGSKFATGQSFSTVQHFVGAMTFGENTQFLAAQDFASNSKEVAAIGLGATNVSVVNFHDLFVAADGGAVTQLSSADGTFETGVIFADFDSQPLTGYQINDVQFTDSNGNGKIDCVSDAACELADLDVGVTLDGDESINISQDFVQTFGAGTDFPAGSTFPNKQNFDNPMDFLGAMTFSPGMLFADSQDFGNYNHDFDKPEIVFGSGTEFPANEEFGIGASFTKGVVSFAGSNTFKENSQFATGQDFTTNTMNFVGSSIFGDATSFTTGQGFTDTQSFGDSSTFVASSFTTGQEFTDGTMNFVGSNTFEDATSFTTGQGFSDTQSFGASSTFVASTFTTGQDFTAGTMNFADSNTFGANNSFANGQAFSNTQSFGTGTSYSGNTNFADTQEFAADSSFGTGQVFDAGESYTMNASGLQFGTDTGLDFGKAREFGDSAKFATGQSFTAHSHDLSADSIQYGGGSSFTKTTFGDSADFSSGVQTFGASSTFGEATEFADSQVFTTAQSFTGNLHFGESTSFTASSQTFSAGTSFGTGTSFTVGQEMPTGIVHSTGLSLTDYTCSDAACTNNNDDAMLSPGEALVSGQDPAAIETSISEGNNGFSVEGLGLSMTFDSVSTDGKISVDLMDPDNVPSLETSGDGIQTISTGTAIGSAMEISASSATSSGNMTISMTYLDADVEAAGLEESDLTMSHYENGEWVEETNCTVDAENNTVTCTVDSID